VKPELIVTAFLLVFGCLPAEACSPLPASQELVPALYHEEPPADAPAILELSYSLQRATGTESASCEDRANMTVFVKPQEWAVPRLVGGPMDVAYEFQTVEATSRDPRVPRLSTPAIYPRFGRDKTYAFVFSWTDTPPARQQDMKFTISVTAVDRWGRRSIPCLLTVREPVTKRTRADSANRAAVCQ
jgi:hypothetical protein